MDITTFRYASGYTAIMLDCIGRAQCKRNRQSSSAPVNENAITATGSLPKIVNQIVNGSSSKCARAAGANSKPRNGVKALKRALRFTTSLTGGNRGSRRHERSSTVCRLQRPEYRRVAGGSSARLNANAITS